MSKLFYNLGRKVGPKVRKARWIWQSMTGTEADAIKAENDVGRDLAHEIRLQLKPDPQPEIEHLLKRPVGRPPKKPRRLYHSFRYQAQSSDHPRRVVAKVEWHQDELFPRVGFIVTDLSGRAKRVVHFYNGRGTDDVDLCPDALYMELTGKSPQEVFPNLRKAGVDA